MAYISNICAILDLTKKKESSMQVSDKLIRPLTEAKYLNADNVSRYRCIMLMRSVSQRKLYRRSE